MSQSVQEMFSRIAGRYDLANDVLSFGIHRLWRKKLISLLNLQPGAKVLDLCCGTGDLAFVSANKIGKTGRVIAVDFVPEMLEHARHKAQKYCLDNVDFIQGDAMQIPAKENLFDASTIGFGIRNVDEPYGCLLEIKRCLRVNGFVGVLEFGQPTFPGFKQIYNFYCAYIMPLLGGLLTGDRSAYVYLPETSKRFVAGEEFLELMKKAGFVDVKLYPLFSGLAYCYIGRKPNVRLG